MSSNMLTDFCFRRRRARNIPVDKVRRFKGTHHRVHHLQLQAVNPLPKLLPPTRSLIWLMIFLYVFTVAYLFQCGYGRQRGQERVRAVCTVSRGSLIRSVRESVYAPVLKIPSEKPEIRLVKIMWVVEDRHKYEPLAIQILYHFRAVG
jgi:hypothetical protein